MLELIRETIGSFNEWLGLRNRSLLATVMYNSFLRTWKESVDLVISDSADEQTEQQFKKYKPVKDEYTLLKDFVRPFKGWYQVKEDLLEQPKRGLTMILVGVAKLLIAVSLSIANILMSVMHLYSVLFQLVGVLVSGHQTPVSQQQRMGASIAPLAFIRQVLGGLVCIADGLAQIASTPVKLLSRAVATAFNGGFLKIVDSGNIKSYLEYLSHIVAPVDVHSGSAKRVLMQLYKGQGFARPREAAIVKEHLEAIEREIRRSLADDPEQLLLRRDISSEAASALAKIARSRQAARAPSP